MKNMFITTLDLSAILSIIFCVLRQSPKKINLNTNFVFFYKKQAHKNFLQKNRHKSKMQKSHKQQACLQKQA